MEKNCNSVDKEVSWELVPVAEIKDFLAIGRPCTGWRDLQRSSHFMTLSVASSYSSSSAAATQDRSDEASLNVHVPGGGNGAAEDGFACCRDDLTSLPLRPGAVECLILMVQDNASLPSLLGQLTPHLKEADDNNSSSSSSSSRAHPVVFVMIPGRITVDIPLAGEDVLYPSTGLQVVTMRQLGPSTQSQCSGAPRVLKAAAHVLMGENTSTTSFGLIQLQQCSQPLPARTSSPAENQQRLLRLIETSLYLDHQYLHIVPPTAFPSSSLSSSSIASIADVEKEEENREYFRLPSPSACSLHLANYYDDWRRIYPELQVMLDNFEAIREEALGVSSWTPWPEYHFRDGGVENDWRVVPFLHTFPATDPSKSFWIPSTSSRCPATVRALKQMPSLRTALLSRLGPDTRLSAHTGWEDLANYVLRVHLTLVVPTAPTEGEGGGGGDNGGAGASSESSKSSISLCGTWVEGEVRCHQVKDFIVFDDSKVHKAFNLHPTDSRVVLIMDLVRPDYLPVGVAVGGHTEELDQFISAFQ